MSKKSQEVTIFPVGSLVLFGGKYYRVETYGLVEVGQPQLLPES